MHIENIDPPDKWTYVVNKKTGEVSYMNTDDINKEGGHMKFAEAIKLLKLDKDIKIKRRNSDFQITSDTLGICTLDFAIEDVISNPIVEAMLAEDWYVVKDEKLHTFEEAIVAFKNGKTIKRKATQTHYNTDRWPPEMALISTQDLMANDWIIIDKEETK